MTKSAPPNARSEFYDACGNPIRCATCGATHRYDCPNNGPIKFLQAVMTDSTVAIRDRMKAADHLLRLKAKGITSDDQPEPAYTVIIPDIPDIKLH